MCLSDQLAPFVSTFPLQPAYSSSSPSSFPSAFPAFSTPSPSVSAGMSHTSSSPSLPSSGEHMMGTTIMAVSFAGGVVMGADSRTSTGSYVANRVSDKVTPVSDFIYCCRSGSAADTQAVSDIVRYYLEAHTIELGQEPLVKTAASLFQELCYTNKDRLLAGIIVGGWDKHSGGQVYALPLGGTLVRAPYALGGSGSTYIYGFVDANYRKGMSQSECEEFVTKAVSHAMARDGSSGGVVRLVTIQESGVTRKFVPGNKLPYMPEQDIRG